MAILKDEYAGFRWHCLECGCVSKLNYGMRRLATDALVKHWGSNNCIPDQPNRRSE